MKNLFSFLAIWGYCFALLGLVTSCQQPMIDGSLDDHGNTAASGVTVKNGRLVFSSEQVLVNTLKKLKAFDQPEQLVKWEDQYKFTSFREIDRKSSVVDLPLGYSSILNENGEYVVGSTIVWFHEKYTHFIPNLDESLLRKIKTDPSSDKNRHEIYIQTIEKKRTARC